MSTTTTPSKPKYNPDLRSWLTSYRASGSLSNRQLAGQLGTNPTAVSKYLSGKPEGNTAKLESHIADLRKAAEQQVDTGDNLFPTSVFRQLTFYADLARATNDFTLLHSPAGLGKTCAIALYKRNNPLTLDLTLNMRNRTDAGLERLVFERCDGKGWSTRQGDRFRFLADRLRGTNRLILIDNAQRITRSGLRWLYDFHDATRCPVCLVGNPEVLDLIEGDDQQFSRTGPFEQLKLTDLKKVSTQLAAQYLPEHADALADLVHTVAAHRGHLRAVKKQTLLTREILKAGKITDPEAAFRAAHTKLIRHYPL